MADLRRSEGVELTQSIGKLWRIAAQIRGLVETSANYEEERERMIGVYSTLTEKCRTYIESLSVFYQEEDRLQIHNGVQEDAMRRATPWISEDEAFQRTQVLRELMMEDIEGVKKAFEWIAK
jgi:hypothetical protein